MNNESETLNDDKPGKELSAIGVRFKSCGKIYNFQIGDIDVPPGTWVIVESDMGMSIGVVARPKRVVENTEQPLKKVLRIASDEDIEAHKSNKAFIDEAKAFCAEKAKSRGLSMKIVSAETTLDRKRLIFYFTADGRIDFRELVRDLAAKFKTRIEMRQIGVRDEVKLIGGIGVCGRETCCSSFLTSFEPVSIRMAKKQELSISQGKLSGVCGRLMCCLGYEYDEFLESKKGEKVVMVKEDAFDKDMELDASDALPDEKPMQPSECLCKSNICPAGKKAAEASSSEKAAKERPEGLRHGKKRRDAGEKPHHVKPDEKQKKAGNAFSKRRKFWKKKKMQNKEVKDKPANSSNTQSS
ncbi:MAG: stage 0 sporulation family protein [Nitrospirae bacterium]|nr:stage 0 sporulation family protein [Nitrospirota bacterium]